MICAFEYLQALRDDYFLIILKLCMKMVYYKCISDIEELVTHKMHCCGNLPIHLSTQQMDSMRYTSLFGEKISLIAHCFHLSSGGYLCHVDLMIMLP